MSVVIDKLATFMPIPIDSIPLDEPLTFPLFVKVAEKFVEFRAVKDTLTLERVLKLREKLDTVFVSSAFWLRYLETMERQHRSGATDTEGQLHHIHSLVLAYGKHLEHSREDQKGAVAKLQSLGNELGSLTTQKPELLTKILKRYREVEIYFSAHSANVAVYSAAIAHKLGYSAEELQTLTFGCLVHNIGNCLMEEQVLYKPDELSEEEWRAMKKHPAQGAHLLEHLKCPTEIILMAKQHHERVDGEGYPYEIGLQEIHPFARICSIADCFDALTSHRPYEVPVSGAEAISIMREMDGKFDPQILRMFGKK